MTSLLGATALVVSTEGQGESSTPVIWCPEDVREVDGHAFMFWRGVDSKGADALTDKVSALTLSQPPTLFAAPDPGDLINSFANGGGKRPRWAATLQDSQQTLIFGFFNGRPPSTALSDLLSAAISGKAQPIGAFGANGKDISVTARPRD